MEFPRNDGIEENCTHPAAVALEHGLAQRPVLVQGHLLVLGPDEVSGINAEWQWPCAGGAWTLSASAEYQCATHLTRWWMMWLPLVLPRLLQNQRLVALHITRVAGSLMPQ